MRVPSSKRTRSRGSSQENSIRERRKLKETPTHQPKADMSKGERGRDRESEREGEKGRGASVRQRTRLSLATPMIHRIYSQTVCQTIGQEFGETRTSVIGAQAQKEIRACKRYVHYCRRGLSRNGESPPGHAGSSGTLVAEPEVPAFS